MKETTKLSKTIGKIVNEYFPNADNDKIGNILWSYTGYPCFWSGDAETCLRKQLQEAKEGIEAGKIYDMEKGWIGNDKN